MNERRVKVVEVGPRDGLQNEKTPLPTSFKVTLIHRLEACGFAEVEVTSMVHPKWVPQLADGAEVMAALNASPAAQTDRTVLVPNMAGLERAIRAGAKRVAVFIAASESFSQKNTNRSIALSLEQTSVVIERAKAQGLSVRGYLSTVFVCPFEGNIAAETSARLTRQLLSMGCDQVSLGDTVGAAVPEDVDALLDLLEGVPREALALHLHDTYGTALANVSRGLQRGVRAFDSSLGGSGGCPYAPGATGNLATEDLLYMLTRGGWEHGIDRSKVLETARFLESGLQRQLDSHSLRVARVCSPDPA